SFSRHDHIATRPSPRTVSQPWGEKERASMRSSPALRFALPLLLLCLSLPARAADNPKALDIGAAAPDFTLPAVDGKNHSLNDYADAKILVIIFTCNHCPTAQAYEARIKQLDADYRDKGMKLIAIQPNDPQALRLDELGYTDLSDSFDEMKLRAKDHDFKFPY